MHLSKLLCTGIFGEIVRMHFLLYILCLIHDYKGVCSEVHNKLLLQALVF